eukprot:scaffold28362_cov65-Phaeocystis_antarctica.AAC.11
MSLMADAKDSMLAVSRLVVGSSRARMPQLRQKLSASASRMTSEARTWLGLGLGLGLGFGLGSGLGLGLRGEDLLPGGAAATHVKARVALGHDDAVALLARACRGLALVLAVDLNAVDVGPLHGGITR